MALLKASLRKPRLEGEDGLGREKNGSGKVRH